jgi:hypothetical protein
MTTATPPRPWILTATHTTCGGTTEAPMTASSGRTENGQVAAGEPGESPGAAVTFATTEHFTLQTARSTTVTEASSRALGFLAVLSSSLIALAFIGQMS